MRNHGVLPRRRFFRDTENGMVGGVCAGIAEYFGFDVTVVRIVTLVACCFLGTPLIIYIVLWFIVPRKPGWNEPTPAERAFHRARGRAHRRRSKTSSSEVRYQFNDLDSRLQRLERHVTSKRYQLDREFDRLKDDD